MNTHSEGSTSNAHIPRRRFPVCPCGNTMKFYISGSTQNPGRPYWKCLHWKLKDSCKLFVWDDELSEARFTTLMDSPSTEASSHEIQSCKACHYAEKLIEASTKEKEKLKTKLANERERVKELTSRFQGVQFVLIVSWVVFAVYVVWVNGNGN